MIKFTQWKKEIRFWVQIRISLLAITCIGVFVTLGKLIFDADAASHKVSNFIFPANVLLTDGKILESQLLIDKVVQESRKYDAVIAGRRYRYRYNSIPLDIEMRYVVGTLGDVEGLIKNNTTINLPPGKAFQTVHQQLGIGYYGLFTYQNKAYLSSCINPQGDSTVTTGQFLHNRHIYNIRLNRFLPWLLGEESFLDRRCLWAHLSITVNNADYQSAYKLLEKAWLSCYFSWSTRFPKY
ncbi:MAG: cyanoexosortase A system-associated protein [Nostoc sp.]|uniref:cyanoexosortase A system-associated protein n=1 Tax=Nostoc sp. TaxID=1180 RepID=UPI002FF4E3F8